MTRRVLAICTGMGLLDKAFIDQGFTVIAGCEIEPKMRRMYQLLVGGEPHLTYDLKDLPELVQGQHFEGIIGGPPCQAHSRMKMHDPKFPDATPLVQALLNVVTCDWFLFENVTAVKVTGGAKVCRMNAMHYGKPHQSRERTFTFRNLTPPKRKYLGTTDSLMAYPAVVGRLYGPKRGAVLQGYPPAQHLPVNCLDLQLGLSNAVPYQMGSAWAKQAWDLHAPKAQNRAAA